MYKTISSINSYERCSSNLAASEETLNPCVVVPAFLMLANLTALSSKEKTQVLALKRTTCKSTRLQMGHFSSYGNDGWGTWFGRSQTTLLTTAITYTHQQVAKVTDTQPAPTAPFGLRVESHTKERGQGTNTYVQQGQTALLCVSRFIAESQRKFRVRFCSRGHSGTPKKLKWELRKKITDKQSTRNMTVPTYLLQDPALKGRTRGGD